MEIRPRAHNPVGASFLSRITFNKFSAHFLCILTVDFSPEIAYTIGTRLREGMLNEY